eukprot:3685503-Pleurochrysis_carterae.AAC.1
MSRIKEKSAAALASSSALACCVEKGWSSGGRYCHQLPALTSQRKGLETFTSERRTGQVQATTTG